MYDISDGDKPYTVVSIHSECFVAHEFEEYVPCTPCSVVFVHVKAFCSQLATEHCWATLSLLYPTSEHILAVDFITFPM